MSAALSILATGKVKLRSPRAFKGAQTGGLFTSFRGTSASIDTDLWQSLPTLRARSRELSNDNAYARAFLNKMAVHVVGPGGVGMQVKALRDDGTVDERDSDAIERAWAEQSRRGVWDVTGRLGRADCERLNIKSTGTDGEFLLRKLRNFGGPGGYAVQVLEADMLDDTFQLERFSDTGNRVRMGVEINDFGRPVAYHLLTKHPGDFTWSFKGVYRERIPADQIVHGFMPYRPFQTRGVPLMHAALLALNDLGEYRAAAIMAARIGAAKNPIITTPDGEPPPGAIDGQGEDGEVEIDIADPSRPWVFPAGSQLAAWDPDYPHEQFGEFNKAMLRGIASALGVAYHTLSGDLEGVNFSSARAGTLEERDMWAVLQEWFIDSLHRQIFPDWLRTKLGARAIAGAGGAPLPLSRFDKFNAAIWQGRRWQWVDPEKDLRAHELAITQRLRSRGDIIREAYGRDPKDVWLEIQREEQELRDLGLMGTTDTETVQ